MIDKKFPSVAPEALIPMAFSFARFLGPAAFIDSIKSVSIAVEHGDDPAASTRLYGVPTIDGQRVVQWIRYPVLGCVYRVKVVVAASDGREWPCTALLPVHEL
jgi:hypothetical protein